jgi:hypothetical protein
MFSLLPTISCFDLSLLVPKQGVSLHLFVRWPTFLVYRFDPLSSIREWTCHASGLEMRRLG